MELSFHSGGLRLCAVGSAPQAGKLLLLLLAAVAAGAAAVPPDGSPPMEAVRR